MRTLFLQCGAAILTGCLLASLWEPFNQSGNVWFCLVPLLLLVRQQLPLKRAFGLGFLAGLVAWCGQLAWMLTLTENGGPWPLVVPALLGLSAVLSVYMGLFTLLVTYLRQRLSARPGLIRMGLVLLLEPALWAGCECLRAHLFSGFAWNPLGLATITLLPIAQLAAWGGAVAVSALVVAVNGGIATLVARVWHNVAIKTPMHWREKLLLSTESFLPLVAFLVVFYLGSWRIKVYQQQPSARDAVLIVEQTDNPSIFESLATAPIPVWQKGQEFAELLPFFKADLWIWPESAVSECIFPEATIQWRLAALVRKAETPLLVGGLYQLPTGGVLNAAMIVTKDGLDKQNVYGKRHLVPFGEYIPFDKVIPWLQQFVPCGRTCEPGNGVAVLTTPSGLRVGPLICFEDTVAKVARESVLKGAEVLVNMSNDAWYANSAEPNQHAQQAILRCIETGVSMVRSTNRGTNTVINAVGSAQMIEGFPTRVRVLSQPFDSFYLRHGEVVFGVPCTLLVLSLVFSLLLGRWVKPRLAVSVLLMLSIGATTTLRAEASLLPLAEMSVDDGNISLAERTAQAVLQKIGLTPEDRAKAEEVLIRSALQKGDWALALQRIEACPELPANRRLAFQLAALCGKGDFAKALAVYDEAQVATDDVWGVTAVRYGLIAAQEMGKKLLVAKRFEEVQQAKGATEIVKAENALAWNEYAPNEASRQALLESASKADRGGIFLTCALALPTAFENVEPTSALVCLDELLKLKGLSTSIEAQLALTAIRLTTDENAKIAYAYRAVGVVREERIRQEALHVLGGLLCEHQESFPKGIDALNEAVVLNPSTTRAPLIQFQIAETLQRYGEQEAALKAYNRYLESYDVPSLAVAVRQGKGRLLIALQRYDEALAVFLEAAERTTETSQRTSLQVEAVDAAIAAGRYTRAIELCHHLLREGARAGIPLRLARSLEASGDLDAAKREYSAVREDVSASEADIFTAVMRLNGMLLAENRYTEAIAEYTRLISDLKQSDLLLQAHLERGRTYYLTDNLKAACEDFEYLSATDSEVSEEARFFRVLCLYRLGEDERARTLAQDYMEAYPDSLRIPDVVLWLAKSDFNRGEYLAAMAEFVGFTERWPTDARVPKALYLAAMSAYQCQDYVATVERVAQLAQQQPEASVIPDARFLQAEALVQQARYAEARDLLGALIRRYPDADWIAEAYGLRGDCLAYTAIDDANRYNLALDAYREAVLRLEDDHDVALMYLFKIGRVLERQNHRDDAAEQYTKLIYRVLNRPEISVVGKQWFQKALTQLRTIEMARGNLSAFETLMRRVRRSQIPGVELSF